RRTCARQQPEPPGEDGQIDGGVEETERVRGAVEAGAEAVAQRRVVEGQVEQEGRRERGVEGAVGGAERGGRGERGEEGEGPVLVDLGREEEEGEAEERGGPAEQRRVVRLAPEDGERPGG